LENDTSFGTNKGMNKYLTLFFNLTAGGFIYLLASVMFSIELTWSLVGFIIVTQIGCNIADALFPIDGKK
jgi:hypothetical protein